MRRWGSVGGVASVRTSATPFGLHILACWALGGVQFIAALRNRYPTLRRWIGRVHVSAALPAAIGGLMFSATRARSGTP
jgi:hypothetical protein